MYFIIVTGSSRGFGRALLEKFGEKDDTKVIGLCRKPSLENEIECDLEDEKSYGNVVERLLENLDEVESFNKILFVHNAGSIGKV